MAVPSQEQ